MIAQTPTEILDLVIFVSFFKNLQKLFFAGENDARYAVETFRPLVFINA